MPAITVDDLTTLQRLERPGVAQQPRRVKHITLAPQGYEGEGFPVRRAFAGVDLADLDPFIHLDQMGEVEYAPGEPKGTSWHPHRGFETVTYMIDGVMEHQDSTGGGGKITDGDTQWMTAGSGILHIERPPQWLVDAGGLFHGLQLWVNLPKDAKLTAPKYQDISSKQVGLFTSANAGALMRVIAGEVGGVRGPGSTHTPMAMVHATVSPEEKVELPWNPNYNALVYTLGGRGCVGIEQAAIQTGNLAVLGEGDFITISADKNQDSHTPQLDVVILGGQPIREALAWAGPFVMNTKAEVVQAFEDYQAGRFGLIPTERT